MDGGYIIEACRYWFVVRSSKLVGGCVLVFQCFFIHRSLPRALKLLCGGAGVGGQCFTVTWLHGFRSFLFLFLALLSEMK